MDNKQTYKYLNDFAKYIIQQSRSNLTKSNKNSSKSLYNSLDSEIKVSANSFRLSFLMEDYGTFVDQGVKGSDPSKVSKNAKITGQQAPNSPYSFKTKRPPSKFLEQWAKQKNFRLRDKKGKFSKGDFKTIGIILAKNIWARGIKPSLFFTKPFEAAFKNLPDELVQAYGLDVEQFLKYTINKK